MDNWDQVLADGKSDGWQKENNKELGKTLFSRTDNSQDVWITWKMDGYIRTFALDLLSVNGFGNPAEEVEIQISKDGIEWKALKMVLSELVPDPTADPANPYWMNTTVTPTNIIGEDYSYIRIVLKPFAAGINWAIGIENLSVTCSEYADDVEMQKGTFVVEEEHVCQFEEEWTRGENSHWHECACGAKADEAECVFGEAWKSNGTSHWHECECGNKIDSDAHVQEELPAVAPSCTEPGKSKGAKCSICERIMIKQTELPAEGHDYVDGVCTTCGHDKNAPETGDLITVFCALSAVSGMAVVALLKKKEELVA